MRWLVLLGCMLAAPALAAEDPVPLKDGPGSELVAAACNACHTSNYIIMNSRFLTPAGWKAEVTKMRTAFGAPIDDEMANEIIAYLGQAYAAKP